jgi:uncharacterized membrane protein
MYVIIAAGQLGSSQLDMEHAMSITEETLVRVPAREAVMERIAVISLPESEKQWIEKTTAAVATVRRTVNVLLAVAILAVVGMFLLFGADILQVWSHAWATSDFQCWGDSLDPPECDEVGNEEMAGVILASILGIIGLFAAFAGLCSLLEKLQEASNLLEETVRTRLKNHGWSGQKYKLETEKI